MADGSSTFSLRALGATVLAIGVGGLLYVFFGRAHPRNFANPILPVGWAELGQCSDTVSLDSQRSLRLSEDHRAAFEDDSLLKPGQDGRNVFVDGEWSYDTDTKQYTVSLKGEAVAYTLVSTDSYCILVKGDLGSADLRASWFSSVPDDSEIEADDRR